MTEINDTAGGSAEDISSADGHLLAFHAHQLRASAIAGDVARERGYQSVSRPTPGDQRPRDMLRRLGIPAWARDEDTRFPGLLIPLYRATGEQVSWQYRPDNPPKDPKTGKVRKYAAPAGRASVLDVHPRHRNAIIDPTIPLWITEGIKKADSLTSRGCCAVALSGVWNWRSHLGTLGDWEDVQLRGRHVIICYDADARENPQIGRAMHRLGKWLKSKGAARVTYIIPPGVNGSQPKGVDDFFAAGGSYEWLCQAGASDTPPVQAGPTSADLVDPEGWMVDQIAEDVLDGSWLWCPSLGWLRYEDRDGRWRILNDKGVAVADQVRRWLKGKYADVAAMLEQAGRSGASTKEIQELEHLAAAWRSVCTASRIGNLVTLARGLVIRDVSDFDTHRDLLNCPNGVLDLRALTLGDHDPDLLFTQVTRARYVPGATHRDWDKALEVVPEDVRDYVQLRYGQAVTGHSPPDNVVFVQLGKGSNGKTTIVYACQGALGKGYFRLISDRAIIADKSQHPTELMDFRGARLAVLEELPEDRLLNMRRIKAITGPEISARYCGQDSAPYDTTHGLTISTNHDPVVAETDYGSWRRLMALRFPLKYWEPGDPEMPDPPGDLDRVAEPGLRERLREPEPALAEAVLSWLADGAKRWYAAGFGPRPERIMRDTRAWQKASNPVFAWAADNVTGDAGHHVWSTEVVRMLRAHLEAAGHRYWSDSVILARFAGCCEALGWKADKREKGKRSKLGTLSRPESSWMAAPGEHYVAWTGVRFRTAQDDAESADIGNLETDAQASDLGVPGVPGVAGDSYTREPTEKLADTPGTAGTRSSSPLDWAALWAMADHSVDTRGWTDEQWAAHERDTAA
jgi:phage/plasmid-associated DNA primase